MLFSFAFYLMFMIMHYSYNIRYAICKISINAMCVCVDYDDTFLDHVDVLLSNAEGNFSNPLFLDTISFSFCGPSVLALNFKDTRSPRLDRKTNKVKTKVFQTRSVNEW